MSPQTVVRKGQTYRCQALRLTMRTLAEPDGAWVRCKVWGPHQDPREAHVHIATIGTAWVLEVPNG